MIIMNIIIAIVTAIITRILKTIAHYAVNIVLVTRADQQLAIKDHTRRPIYSCFRSRDVD